MWQYVATIHFRARAVLIDDSSVVVVLIFLSYQLFLSHFYSPSHKWIFFPKRASGLVWLQSGLGRIHRNGSCNALLSLNRTPSKEAVLLIVSYNFAVKWRKFEISLKYLTFKSTSQLVKSARKKKLAPNWMIQNISPPKSKPTYPKPGEFSFCGYSQVPGSTTNGPSHEDLRLFLCDSEVMHLWRHMKVWPKWSKM